MASISIVPYLTAFSCTAILALEMKNMDTAATVAPEAMARYRRSALAREAGASMVVDSDAHSSSDIFSPNWREKVAFGSGLTADELERINKTMISLVEKLVPSTFFA